MTTRAPLGNASSYLLPVATAATAIAIFVGDIVTPLDVSVATLYVVVVLMAARFCQPRGIWLVAAGCLGLTAVGSYLSPPAISEIGRGRQHAHQPDRDRIVSFSRGAGLIGGPGGARAGQPPLSHA